MTHIIKYDNSNLFLLGEGKAAYFTLDGDFEQDDKVILQDGRKEAEYYVVDVLRPLSLKKNMVMLNLSLIV